VTRESLATLLVVVGTIMLLSGSLVAASGVAGLRRLGRRRGAVAALEPVIDVRDAGEVIDLREIDQIWSAAIPSRSSDRDE
jgi:hypothetical protein